MWFQARGVAHGLLHNKVPKCPENNMSPKYAEDFSYFPIWAHTFAALSSEELL